jgi:hypothetical protein
MKITIIAKPEPVHQFKLRIPESLKALIDVNRKLADARGADYNATAIEAFTRFNHDFNAQLTSSASGAGTNSEPVSGTASGTNAESNPGPVTNGRKIIN